MAITLCHHVFFGGPTPLERNNCAESEGLWGGWWDSNPRQPEPQSGVLPLNYTHHEQTKIIAFHAAAFRPAAAPRGSEISAQKLDRTHQFISQPPFILQQFDCPQPADGAAAALLLLTAKVESCFSSLAV